MSTEKSRGSFAAGRITVAVGVFTLFVGCASIPDVEVSYRPVKWSMLLTVVHTITCNHDDSLAIIERGANFLPIYFAGPADPRFRLRLKDLDRYSADADFTVGFTDDGRLKSINASTVGQGESVVKGSVAAAASLASVPVALAAVPAGAVSLFSQNVLQKRIADAKPATICNVVRKWTLTAPSQLPQVSLVQTTVLRGVPSDLDPVPTEDQRPLLAQLQESGLDLNTKVSTSFVKDELQPIAKLSEVVGSEEVPLRIQRMVTFKATVKDAQGDIGIKSIPVPTSDTFVLPVPKAALFGKQSFSLLLAESGRISNMGYGRTAGTPGAMGALTALAGAETTEDNTQAAAMKAASDLIAQQQRYSNCKLKPTECK